MRQTYQKLQHSTRASCGSSASPRIVRYPQNLVTTLISLKPGSSCCVNVERLEHVHSLKRRFLNTNTLNQQNETSAPKTESGGGREKSTQTQFPSVRRESPAGTGKRAVKADGDGDRRARRGIGEGRGARRVGDGRGCD